MDTTDFMFGFGAVIYLIFIALLVWLLYEIIRWFRRH